jgi:hypothetical protein
VLALVSLVSVTLLLSPNPVATARVPPVSGEIKVTALVEVFQNPALPVPLLFWYSNTTFPLALINAPPLRALPDTVSKVGVLVGVAQYAVCG